MAPVSVQSDDQELGLPSFEATVNAILLLGSCLEAKVGLSSTAVDVEVRGAFQAVQPLRRGRSNARVSDSSWWPEGFHWVLSAHIAESVDLRMLTRKPVLVATCPCMDSSGPCSSPTDAINFMTQHSSHCQSWQTQLDRKQQLQLQLQQEMAQVQQNQSEALALPIQRTASLVCLEAVHLLLRTPELSHLPALRQLARAVLDHPVMWHVTSFYRPDPKHKPPALRSPHLLWLVAGAPPYCRSASMMPPALKHCSLEACALVCCLRRCNSLPQQDRATGYADHDQLAAAIQQLAMHLCDASIKPEQRAKIQACIKHEAFVSGLLQMRGLRLEDVAAAAQSGMNKQLRCCVICGGASSERHKNPLISCKTCCHSYHVSCALVEGSAEALYSMPAYPTARAGTCLACQHFPLRATSATGGLPWALAAGDQDQAADAQGSGVESAIEAGHAGAAQLQGKPTAWDAAVRVTASHGEASGAVGGKFQATMKTVAASRSEGGASAGQQPAAGSPGETCQPVPDGPVPPSADASAVKLHVLDQLEQRDIPVSTLTCGTLLHHGLLPEGLHIDFTSQGRFKVVAAVKGGASQHKQVLRCTVPGCGQAFSTWQAAELHGRPGANSRRHSTEEMHITGTGVSIKKLLKMVRSERPTAVQPEWREQHHQQPTADFTEYVEHQYEQCQARYEQYRRQNQQYEQREHQPAAAAGADEDAAAYALQLLSAATRQQHLPVGQHPRMRPAAAAGAYDGVDDAGRPTPPGLARPRLSGAVARKRWLEPHEQQHDNSSDVSVTSTATAAERAGAEANKQKRQCTGLQVPLQQQPWLQLGDRDQRLLQDQKPGLDLSQLLQLAGPDLSQPQQGAQEQQRQQLSMLKPIMLGVRVVRAEPAIRPVLLSVMQSGDVELLQQQLDFWAPETRLPDEEDEAQGAGEAAAASLSPRGWDFSALTHQGIPQLISDVCSKAIHGGAQQAVVMQLCMDTVAAAFASQQLEGEVHAKSRQLTKAMLQLARSSLECNSVSHLNLSTAMLAAAAAAVTVPGSTEQRLDQLLSICGSLKVLCGSLGEALWSGVWQLLRTRVVREGVIVDYGLSALQHLLLLVCAAPAAWQVALLLPHISTLQQQQLQQSDAVVRSSSLLQALFAALYKSFQLKQQCAAQEAGQQQQQPDQQRHRADRVQAEAAAERMHAKASLLPAFARAMAAATTWLASNSSSMQLCAVHDLLVKQVVMMQQLLRALLLKDQQLHNVLAVISCGFADSLLNCAVKSLNRARRVFELAAGREGEAAAQAVLGCQKSVASEAVVCECESHAAAFDCKLLGELIETTITHTARPAG